MNKKTLNLIELIIAAALSLLLIKSSYLLNSDLDKFAYGETTQAFYAKQNENFVHVEKLNSNSLNNLKRGWEKRGEKEVLFILGNSQTSAINQKKISEVNYVKLLSDKLSDRYDVICHSMPNANLQEMLYSFMFFQEKYPVKKLIIPVFMDDLREDNIRSFFFRQPISDLFNIEHNSSISKTINSEIKTLNSDLNQLSIDNNLDMKALDETVQKKVEEYLDDKLSDVSEYWASRKNMRGRVMIFLYKLRNTVLGINPQTKRKLIKRRFDKNFDALKVILDFSEGNNIEVLLYVPPIRNDVEVPYVIEEYDNFKFELQKLSKKYKNITFLNLESTVNEKYWGTKESTILFGGEELDFMHFQFQGHKILYENLINGLK